MTGWKPVLIIYILMSAVAATAYAAPGVEVNGDMKLSGTGTIGFPNGSRQTTARTDCTGRYELNGAANLPNGDGTVTDCRTGLIWLKNAKCTDYSNAIENRYGLLSWALAKDWAKGLGNGICGLQDGSSAGDWRLPTKTEWMAMVQSARNHNFKYPALTNAAGTGHWAAGDIFDNIQSDLYWSSSERFLDYVWYADMFNGDVNGASNPSTIRYVWPVRSGQ